MKRGNSSGGILLLLFIGIALPILFLVLIVKVLASIGNALNSTQQNNNSKNISNNNSNNKEKYDKIFPHLTTDETDSDDDQFIDDLIWMDMMDDD